MFGDSSQEVVYADVELGPIWFLDDQFRFASSVHSAQAGLVKMEQMAEGKLIDYNLKKTCYMIFGEKKEKNLLEEEVTKFPLTLYGKPAKKV